MVDRLAILIAGLNPERIVRIGIDGVDGAGKTTLGDALAAALTAMGRSTIRASVDDFHRPKAARYARGRHSPDGHYLDSYDYDAFRERLLDPLSPHGSRRFINKSFDLDADTFVSSNFIEAKPDAALIVDGIFLHRRELRSYWDLSIFLKVAFEISVPRGAQRAPALNDPNPDCSANRRYVAAQKRYFQECQPEQRADIVIDYDDLFFPKILKCRLSSGLSWLSR